MSGNTTVTRAIRPNGNRKKWMRNGRFLPQVPVLGMGMGMGTSFVWMIPRMMKCHKHNYNHRNIRISFIVEVEGHKCNYNHRSISISLAMRKRQLPPYERFNRFSTRNEMNKLVTAITLKKKTMTMTMA